MVNVNVKNIDCHATLAMAKNAQGCRSLLAECGTDAPQSGRSMIEMLGVLAIIGVLSVGGIAGYSKAMQKYRINKAIEQITLIAGNVRSFFAPQRSYEGLGNCYNDNDACKLIKKAKLMPDEMWDDTAKKFNNVFGHYVNLYTAHKSSNTDNQAFMISYRIPADYELCIDLLSQDWTAAGVKGIVMAANGPTSAVTTPADIDYIVSECSKMVRSGISTSGYIGLDIYFDVNANCWSSTQTQYGFNVCS